MTPYILAPFFISCFLFVGIYLYEKRCSDRELRCPTCCSGRKKARYIVRYWVSDYLYNDSLCEDQWHNTVYS